MSERDEFEAWAHERFGYLLPFQRYTDGRYVAAPVSHIWDAWQAARAPHAVPALTEPVAQDECAQDVYEHGQSIGLFDIPKETANAICAGIAAITGARVDWHYIGGRVHMKALAAPQPSPEPGIPDGSIGPEGLQHNALLRRFEHEHDWRFSLQDHMYKCDCGATRGDYPFGAASFKD